MVATRCSLMPDDYFCPCCSRRYILYILVLAGWTVAEFSLGTSFLNVSTVSTLHWAGSPPSARVSDTWKGRSSVTCGIYQIFGFVSDHMYWIFPGLEQTHLLVFDSCSTWNWFSSTLKKTLLQILAVSFSKLFSGAHSMLGKVASRIKW